MGFGFYKVIQKSEWTHLHTLLRKEAFWDRLFNNDNRLKVPGSWGICCRRAEGIRQAQHLNRLSRSQRIANSFKYGSKVKEPARLKKQENRCVAPVSCTLNRIRQPLHERIIFTFWPEYFSSDNFPGRFVFYYCLRKFILWQTYF